MDTLLDECLQKKAFVDGNENMCRVGKFSTFNFSCYIYYDVFSGVFNAGLLYVVYDITTDLLC